ncbi:hypothetical protein OAD66_07105 [Bacteroidia bacterium]|nr:hypothetical protein [Bacteroidia bacterium]MDB9882885.1 hypothetical protein [Bacteroidia bacterium]
MATKLLYIEDDEIDVLALKRLLRQFDDVELTVCKYIKDLLALDLSKFDSIISDANLPDGSFKKLQTILPESKTQFTSGSKVEGVKAWIKPISTEQLLSILQKNSIVDLSYIEDLAEGDEEYEQEMIELALKVLPDRLNELCSSKNDEEALRRAAHKTKSSYRVCGINNSLLTELEGLKGRAFNDIDLKTSLLSKIEEEIESAIAELKSYKN